MANNPSRSRVPPEWTSEELLLVRQMGRQGASSEEIREALNSPLTARGVRIRARRYGISLDNRRQAHLGTSTLYLPGKDTKDRNLIG